MISVIRRVVVSMVLLAGPALGATVTIEQVLRATAPNGNGGGATSTPAVPGRPAPFVFRGDGLGPPPSINEAGEIVFRARSASSNDTNIGTAHGIYAKRPGFPMAVLMDNTVTGGLGTYPVPGRPANNRFDPSNVRFFRAPIINNAGDVLFHARFLSPGTTPDSGIGIYATKVTGGPLVKIVDTFDAVPSFPTSTFNTFDSFNTSQNDPSTGLTSIALTFGMNDFGQVVYWGQFLIPGNTTQRNGIFGTTVAGGAGVRLADSTETIGPVSVPLPSTQNGNFRQIRWVSAINNAGTVAFCGNIGPSPQFRGGVFVVPVTGGPITTVAFMFQPTPSRPGFTFTDTFEPGGHNVDINDSGVVIFRNQYSFSGQGDFCCYAAFPSGPGYVHKRIFDTSGGIPIPTEPPGSFEPANAEFNGFVLPRVNEVGQVAPYSFVFPNSPVPNQQGIYLGDTDDTPVAFKLIANILTPPPGQPAPVGGFPKFQSFVQSNGALGVLNNQGNATFLATGNVSTSVGFRGLYFYDACVPQLVRISDSTVSNTVGNSGFLGGFVANGYDIWQVETTSGMYRAINENNDVPFAASFTNFDYGLYIAHITGTGGGQLTITCPADVTAECPANTVASATGTATATGCGTITISHSDVTTTGCGGTASVARTWTADNGATTASCVQTITEADTTGPVLSGVPANAAVQCDALPPAASVTALDACQGGIPVTLSETQVAGSCPGTYVLTRTWTATDGCGNSTSASQDVAVMDSLDPVLVGVPGDVAVECDAVPAPAAVTGSDTCDTTVPVTFVETRTNGSCPDEYTLTRSWTAVDDCANDVTGQQFVSVDDTTAPLITCPPYAALECPADTGVAANGSATATDNCSTPSIGSSDATMTGCGTTLTIMRTWTASDDCSNSSMCDQFVAVVDTTAPVITVDTTPITATDTDCSGAETVTLPTGTANDACDGPRPVTNDAAPPFPAGQSTAVTYTSSDACANSAMAMVNVTVLYGADIRVQAAKHTTGTGPHPSSTKVPLVGILVGAYDKSDGSCARLQDQQGDGISWQEYAAIVANCIPVGTAVTGSDGVATLNLPPGDYVVISHFDSDGDSVLDQFIGVSASDLACGQLMQKHLQLLVDANGTKKPGKTTRLTGSELLIIEPEYVIWDNTVQLYPFVFETIGDWGITATVAPPDGFVADYPALSEEVDNSLEAVQFTITEVGSDLVPTQTTFRTEHNGRVRNVRSKVDIRLTPDYAKARGFNVDQLRARGLIADPAQRQLQPNNGQRRADGQ